MTGRTEWFHKTIKPVHKGLYETRLAGNPCVLLAMWTGKQWKWRSGQACLAQGRHWRGLVEKV